MKPTIDPATIHPRMGILLVKKYVRPEETPGGIILPEQAREDDSWTTWEIIKAGDGCADEAGFELEAGDIVRTMPEPGVDSGYLDENDLKPMFFVGIDRAVKVIRWK